MPSLNYRLPGAGSSTLVKTLLVTAILTVISTVMTPAASADQTLHKDLVLQEPHTFETAPGAPTAGAYVTIMNLGDTDDTLIGGELTAAESLQIHEMRMQGDVMQMRHLESGLKILANDSTILERGGYHLMFIGLKAPLKEGDSVTATLTFEKAGNVEVTFPVRDLASATGHSHGKKTEKAHKKHSHGNTHEHTHGKTN